MAVTLAVIAFLFYSLVFSDQKQKMNRKSSTIFYNIYPRNKAHDSWTLKVPRHPLMYGAIYESKIYNKSRNNIADWKLYIDIKKKCCINNSWNGQVEIHQKTKEGLKIQAPISLGNMDPSELTVDNYHSQTNPTLIFLNPGDKIIYHPDERYSERFIPSSDDNDPRFSNIGFIFYTLDPVKDTTDFLDSYIIYHLQGGLQDNIMIYVLSAISIMWIILASILIRLKILETAKEKDRIHDRQATEQIMTVFTKFIDAKDIYTGGHSERVAHYARLIAKEAGRNEDFCQKVFYCGLLHDCGKISVGDTILRKSGEFTMNEFQIIRDHTIKGYELLKSLSSIPEACLTALYHHERYDGTGYPEHLKSSQIPEIARIVAVADSYDTMKSDRNYRKGFSTERIISELRENSGTQFDPEFVSITLNLIKSEKI